MSLFAKLMIAGWTSAFALVGFYALSESGKLLRLRQRIALWLGAERTRESELPLEADRTA